MNDIEVSVVMPAYNAEAYLAEQIESVLAQDCGGFELLIGEDGSQDATWSVVRRYAADPRVRAFRNQANLGAGATRNKLNELARGRYLTPCDADDLMMPGSLSRLRAHLDTHPRTVMAYGAYLMLEEDGSERLRIPPWVRGKSHSDSWDFVEFVANHAGSMMRRDAVLAVGGYEEDIPVLDSVSLTLKLAEVGDLDYLDGEVLYAYRRHSGSTSARNPDWYPTFRKLVRAAMKRRAENPAMGKS